MQAVNADFQFSYCHLSIKLSPEIIFNSFAFFLEQYIVTLILFFDFANSPGSSMLSVSAVLF